MSSRAVALATFGACALVACGGSVGGSGESARAAARANDPRMSDPTAAAPATRPEDARLPSTTAGAPSAAASAAPPPAGSTASTAAKTAPTKIGARHVLVQWMGSERAPTSVVRTREQALAIAQEVHRRAKAGEDFPRLAVEYSDEPGAGGRGGSLGRFGKGQMVPAFEEAAFKLEVGQVSDIVESSFGFHVIQRTE